MPTIELALPAYDVVIPSYNRAASVEQAIESVLLQRYPATRIIVVDDGSDDGTADLLVEMERRHASVRAVLLPRNAGASAARNAGLALVREAWIAFLDSDDRWLPGAAEALLTETLEGALDIVVGQFQRSWPDGVIDPPSCGWIDGDIRAALAGSGAVGPSWSLIRSRIARLIGGFDPSFHNCNDWDFFTRAASAGARFGRIESAIALYHYAGSGRLSHDHHAGGINAARVRAHSYLADARPC